MKKVPWSGFEAPSAWIEGKSVRFTWYFFAHRLGIEITDEHGVYGEIVIGTEDAGRLKSLIGREGRDRRKGADR